MNGFSMAKLLDDKEERYKKQTEMIVLNKLPVISFTINKPGTEKNNEIIKNIFASGLKEIESVLSVNNIEIMDRYCSSDGLSGPIIILSINFNPNKIKEWMVDIENNHPIGRLLDIDVIDEQRGHISRINLGFEARKCLICNDYAKICSRSQRHDMGDVLKKFYNICFLYIEKQQEKT
ncbi:MAG: putative apo-citrate lyase phosphoribosyl-dephospho-CoA transferase [Clostridiales bacterium 38_11]|nr:MAG: putative apo-citrate lyase phosphoribosyl-dephospho-CoA transferase [Clostridiales bacterium 38_11]HBH12024.1 citrate lyase holo-[acyl-carrier protein] synthase [Clostridiales bacterium]